SGTAVLLCPKLHRKIHRFEDVTTGSGPTIVGSGGVRLAVDAYDGNRLRGVAMGDQVGEEGTRVQSNGREDIGHLAPEPIREVSPVRHASRVNAGHVDGERPRVLELQEDRAYEADIIKGEALPPPIVPSCLRRAVATWKPIGKTAMKPS